MSDAELPTGYYYIRNAETFAGRNRVEDRSLRPKRVNCPPDDPPEVWAVKQLENGRYTLYARGAPTAESDRLLYALLIDSEKAEEWIITKRNNDQYTIEKADRSAGWVKQDGDNPQIAVHILIVRPSEPPSFPPNELWDIQPLED